MIAAKADIIEEVELGRTLLSQGHLETAQKVLLKICQQQPELARAFRALAEVLERRGDGTRARTLRDYADELDGDKAQKAQRAQRAQKTAEIQTPLDASESDADTHQTRLEDVVAPPPPVVKKHERLAAPQRLVASEAPLTLPTPAQNTTPTPGTQSSSPGFAPAPRPRRRRFLVLLVALGVASFIAGVAGYALYGRAKPVKASARDELERALVSGSLEVLMRARELARMSLDARAAKPDDLVRLALVDALLTCDYAMDAAKDAEEALRRAESGSAGSKERAALAATARALLALAAGNRQAAQQQAAVAVEANAPEVPAFALLASARASTLSGDHEGAAKTLDRALGVAPDLLPVAVDWAASRIDGGDAVVARRTLLAVLGKSPDNARAQLVLGEAERALGEPAWIKRFETACASDSKISRTVRAACATASALQTRLDGDRAGAVRKARAISQTTDDPALLGQLSMLLALLGEVDAADEVLQRAGKVADGGMVPLQWAAFAIRLGRGESLPASPVLDHPAGPERYLVALRAAYVRSGKEGLAAIFKSLPPGILDIDFDARAFSMLARDTAPSKPELAALDKKGNPVAAYVLALFALQDNDFKLAVRRLEHSLSLHGDACRAASLYLEAFKAVGRGAVLNKAGLRAIRARNAKCPLPET